MNYNKKGLDYMPVNPLYVVGEDGTIGLFQ
jgi:hypothetical protein